jgi:hypothetical protein
MCTYLRWLTRKNSYSRLALSQVISPLFQREVAGLILDMGRGLLPYSSLPLFPPLYVPHFTSLYPSCPAILFPPSSLSLFLLPLSFLFLILVPPSFLSLINPSSTVTKSEPNEASLWKITVQKRGNSHVDTGTFILPLTQFLYILLCGKSASMDGDILPV